MSFRDKPVAVSRRLRLFYSLHVTTARVLLLAGLVMKVLREYSRLVMVYASFAAFLAVEAAVIFIVYRHMGIM